MDELELILHNRAVQGHALIILLLRTSEDGLADFRAVFVAHVFVEAGVRPGGVGLFKQGHEIAAMSLPGDFHAADGEEGGG